MGSWLTRFVTGHHPAALAVTTGLAGLLVWGAWAAFFSLARPGGSAMLSSSASARLPVFRIDVAGDEVRHGEKTPGTLQIVEDYGDEWTDAVTVPASLESRIAIELRGASSIILPKKSYEFELRDNRDDDRDLPLLGLPAHSDWVLHGCGQDDTCLRNALAYALARDIGRYAPRTRFIELFIDDRYQGLYVLVERIRRGADRVDLPRPAADGERGDISGGYIFKMDLAEGHPTDAVPRDWVSPVTSLVYSYHYPRFDDITAAQKTYLHDQVAAFERLMLGVGWDDPEKGYRAWIDVASWVDFALLQELSNNIDSYQKSHYFQKWPASRGNKIALGPVWDFDNAFGSTRVRDGHRTDVWAHEMNRFGAGDEVPYQPPGLVPHVPVYWERLWTDPAFQQELRCRWDVLRQGALHVDAVTARIDSWRSELALAQPRNDTRWGIAEAYNARISRLKTWLAARLSWMDASLPGACPSDP